ncbi:hypothetical protein M422DRAFT_240945 [Sphaerobolus stellatus SS14]|nr:hypothetical protein M422DRAFT_240945 [Sphaerobolus stellatus SS14]
MSKLSIFGRFKRLEASSNSPVKYTPPPPPYSRPIGCCVFDEVLLAFQTATSTDTQEIERLSNDSFSSPAMNNQRTVSPLLCQLIDISKKFSFPLEKSLEAWRSRGSQLVFWLIMTAPSDNLKQETIRSRIIDILLSYKMSLEIRKEAYAACAIKGYQAWFTKIRYIEGGGQPYSTAVEHSLSMGSEKYSEMEAYVRVFLERNGFRLG